MGKNQKYILELYTCLRASRGKHIGLNAICRCYWSSQVVILFFCSFTAATPAAIAPSASQLGVMPSSIPTLPLAMSVPLTTSASTPNPSQVTAATGPIASSSALALMLNAASGNLPQDALAGDRVFITHGLPTVPKSLLEKIQRWEFIDLVDLLPAQSAHDDLMNPMARFTLFPGCEFIRPKRRQIQSIMEWVKAFTVYMAVLLQKHPSQLMEMLAYQLTVIKAAQQYDGLQWRAYDTHFRLSAAATGNKTWSKIGYRPLYQIFHWSGKSGDNMLNLRQLTTRCSKLPFS